MRTLWEYRYDVIPSEKQTPLQRPKRQHPVVARKHPGNLISVSFCQQHQPHSGIIIDDLLGSGSAGLGNGDGTFQAPVSIVASVPPPGYMIWIAAGDLNNAGFAGLVYVAEIDGAGLYVLLNDQHGGFTLSTVKNDGEFAAVMLADLNRDGKLDAVGMSEGAYAAISWATERGIYGRPE